MYDYVNIFFKANPPGLNLWYFMKPLQATVIIILFLSLFFAGSCESLSRSVFTKTKFSLKTLANNGDFIRSVFEQSPVKNYHKGSQRIVVASASLIAVVVMATFKGSLLTFLGIFISKYKFTILTNSVTNSWSVPLKYIEDVETSEFSLAAQAGTSHITLFKVR